MAITTIRGHVSRAIDFFKKENVYIGLGKTTPWQDSDRTTATPARSRVNEDNPPIPVPTGTLTEVFGYKKIDQKLLVIPDPNGTIRYRSKMFRQVTEQEAYQLGAIYVYLSVEIDPTDFASNLTYRQLGIYSGLRATTTNKVLTPADVSSEGLLEIIDYRKPQYRETDQKEKISFIIEF